MTQFLRTALYAKNLPPLERLLRITAALLGIAAAIGYLAEPWQQWLGVASAVGFALTGVLGFCPACAVVGRTLTDRTAQ